MMRLAQRLYLTAESLPSFSCLLHITRRRPRLRRRVRDLNLIMQKSQLIRLLNVRPTCRLMLATLHRLLVILTTHLSPLLRPESEHYRMVEEEVVDSHPLDPAG